MTGGARFGVLLPHFGRQASRERLVEGSVALERAGFDSVWVRDHVIFNPYDHEGRDRTFWEPLVTLGAVAAVTERLVLGLGCLIPHRHPVHAAQLLGTLDRVAGGGRVVVGMGLGSSKSEFAALGMEDWDRKELFREHVEIMRRLWSGERLTYEGGQYRFRDVAVSPTPAGGALPIWHGGASEASARRAVELCDGWLSGRIPLRDFEARAALMRELAERGGKPVPELATIPYVIPDRSAEQAGRRFDLAALLAEAQRWYSPPPSGRFESLSDLRGAVMAGPAEEIVEQTREFVAAGAGHVVFDLRVRFDDWEECVALLATEVLPALRIPAG